MRILFCKCGCVSCNKLWRSQNAECVCRTSPISIRVHTRIWYKHQLSERAQNECDVIKVMFLSRFELCSFFYFSFVHHSDYWDALSAIAYPIVIRRACYNHNCSCVVAPQKPQCCHMITHTIIFVCLFVLLHIFISINFQFGWIHSTSKYTLSNRASAHHLKLNNDFVFAVSYTMCNEKKQPTTENQK